MRNEFTAVVERAGRWHIAYCPEIPGANGQGRTKAAALKSLSNGISLILEDRRTSTATVRPCWTLATTSSTTSSMSTCAGCGIA